MFLHAAFRFFPHRDRQADRLQGATGQDHRQAAVKKGWNAKGSWLGLRISVSPVAEALRAHSAEARCAMRVKRSR